VAEDGVEALVRGVSRLVELGGQPDTSLWQAGRDHVDLGCCIDLGARSRRQLIQVGGSGFGHAAGVVRLRVSAGELIRAAARGACSWVRFRNELVRGERVRRRAQRRLLVCRDLHQASQPMQSRDR
jgi:hypothetical protein